MYYYLGEMFEYWRVTHVEHKELLSFLIKNEDELEEFMEDFYEGNIMKNTIDYQRFRKNRNKITVEVFEELYRRDKKIALEQLFQEPFTEYMIGLIYKYSITCKEIFDKHYNNPSISFLEIIKSNHTINNRNYSDDFLLDI